MDDNKVILFEKAVKLLTDSGLDFEKCYICKKLSINFFKTDNFFLCQKCSKYCPYHKKYYDKKQFNLYHASCKENEILSYYKPIINPLLCKFRIIRINNISFFINDDLQEFRCNLIYYSKDFEELLKNKYNITIDEQDVYRGNKNREILNIFHKEKDNLKHLSWKIDGYY